MKNKNILTIETSLGRIFLAVIKDSTFLSKSIASPGSVEEDINHLLEDIINEAMIQFHEIDLILVSLGPGSFTGIRIGISVAKALSISTGAKIIGFSNFDSILHQFLASNKYKKARKIEVLIKGPGDEFYKKIFNDKKPEKKNYLITKKELQGKTPNNIIVGNFLNTLKIKNYYFCLPDQLGIKSVVEKIKKNMKTYNFSEPEPIYIKEHYAKKYD